MTRNTLDLDAMPPSPSASSNTGIDPMSFARNRAPALDALLSQSLAQGRQAEHIIGLMARWFERNRGKPISMWEAKLLHSIGRQAAGFIEDVR